MLVKMKSRAAWPEAGRVLQPGQVADVPDEMARAWIEGGYAEEATAEAAPEVEQADQAPKEKAVIRPRRGRSKKVSES